MFEHYRGKAVFNKSCVKFVYVLNFFSDKQVSLSALVTDVLFLKFCLLCCKQMNRYI